jgi:hypothetical protein
MGALPRRWIKWIAVILGVAGMLTPALIELGWIPENQGQKVGERTPRSTRRSLTQLLCSYAALTAATVLDPGISSQNESEGHH